MSDFSEKSSLLPQHHGQPTQSYISLDNLNCTTSSLPRTARRQRSGWYNHPHVLYQPECNICKKERFFENVAALPGIALIICTFFKHGPTLQGVVCDRFLLAPYGLLWLICLGIHRGFRSMSIMSNVTPKMYAVIYIFLVLCVELLAGFALYYIKSWADCPATWLIF